MGSIAGRRLRQFPFLGSIRVRGLLTCVCVRKSVRAICRLRLIRRLSQRAVRCLLPFIYMRPISGGRSIALGRVLGCKGRRTIAHVSIPLCGHGKCRGGCLNPTICGSIGCKFRCQRGICTNVITRGSDNRPFKTLRGGRKCSCCSFCLLLRSVKVLGAKVMKGCQLGFNRKLMLKRNSVFKGATCSSSFAFEDANVHERASASRCGCFHKDKVTLG